MAFLWIAFFLFVSYKCHSLKCYGNFHSFTGYWGPVSHHPLLCCHVQTTFVYRIFIIIVMNCKLCFGYNGSLLVSCISVFCYLFFLFMHYFMLYDSFQFFYNHNFDFILVIEWFKRDKMSSIMVHTWWFLVHRRHRIDLNAS